MQEIEERSDGDWRPSSGSVYPALSQLEDEGLVAPGETDGRKTFSLTDAGNAHVEENRESLGEPWNDLGPKTKGAYHDLRRQLKALMGAVQQIAQTGSEPDVKLANDALAEARRKIYSILAEDHDHDDGQE
jgi:DNA-binding PadR family transcriptional regulator